MSPAGPAKGKALDLAKKLLTRRLERAGIPVSNLETIVQLEALDPEPYQGGVQVRVDVWSKWSGARVKLDSDKGELLGYSVAAYSEPMTHIELTQEHALAVAASLMNLPAEAELESFQHVEYTARRRLVELRWRHVHRGLPVEGDWIRVVFHPSTHRIVEFERFWREVRL